VENGEVNVILFSLFSKTEHLAFGRSQDDDVWCMALDHASGEAAQFVVYPDILSCMQAEIILPEPARE
jgi:hypothetical protein